MRRVSLLRAALVAGVGVLVATGIAFADGTPSGTSIDNYATVDYTVGGVPQNPANSDTATFVVDNKVDVLVSTIDGSAVLVTPGDTLQVLTFEVTNEGNTTHDYSLAATASATPAFGEPSEDFDATNVGVFVDANGNGTYDPLVDVATYIDELEADSSVVVFVVSDIPLGLGDGEVASYDLTATTAAGGAGGSQGADLPGTDDSGSADDPATVQTVYADDAGTTDSDNDRRHSSKSAYKVRTATLDVTKTADVSDDPINGGTNPKAIPGATVDYAISVENTGSAAATSVQVVDSIPANTAFVVGSVSPSPAGGVTVAYSDDNGATWTYSPSAGPDGSDSSVTDVRVIFPSIAVAATATVDFQVLIL